MEQKTYNLSSFDGQYHNFFKFDLPKLESQGWYIMFIDCNTERSSGVVILQRKN